MILALLRSVQSIHTCTVPLDGMMIVPVSVDLSAYTLFLPVQYPPVNVAPVAVTNTSFPLGVVALKLNDSPATYVAPDDRTVDPRVIVSVPAVLVVVDILP